MSYEVMCVCGQFLRGDRQRRRQAPLCPACGRRVFVLPASPFDQPDSPVDPGVPLSEKSFWRIPLFVGGLSTAVLLAGFLAVWPYLMRSREGRVDESSSAPIPDQVLKAALHSCRRLMAMGKFHLARRALNDPLELRRLNATVFRPEQNRRLNRLFVQADLLARLAVVPIEEVVFRAMLTRDPEEWDEELSHFRGRGYVFDGVVRRDDRGRPVIDYVVEVNGQVARLALEDLEVMADLPLDEGPRMIFGGRLADCDREAGGGWVVHFEPASGVLFTDLEAVQAASPVKLAPGLADTLARQKQWLTERARGS